MGRRILKTSEDVHKETKKIKIQRAHVKVGQKNYWEIFLGQNFAGIGVESWGRCESNQVAAENFPAGFLASQNTEIILRKTVKVAKILQQASQNTENY